MANSSVGASEEAVDLQTHPFDMSNWHMGAQEKAADLQKHYFIMANSNMDELQRPSYIRPGSGLLAL